MNLLDALFAFAAACLGSVVLTPLGARLAIRVGAVDAPDDRRKWQQHAIPLGGGLAVALAAGFAVAASLVMRTGTGEASASAFFHSALPSALVLLAIGLADDVIGLTGIYKLIGQMLSASLLVAAGFRFHVVSFAGWALPLGDLSIPFSLFFCLGAINAFNLIDGADALAASIGAIVCLTLGVIAGMQGAVIASLASFAAAGALVGFLPYNAPPARVYLGDTGSMLIGWIVAAVAIRSSIKEQAAVALTVPIAICAIPILDAAAALVRRVTTGQSVFTTDRGHLHHALLLRGWSVGQTAAVAAGLTALTCAGAIASYFADNETYAVVAAAGVVMALAGARVFGHAEAALLASHARSMVRGAVRRVRPSGVAPLGSTDQAVQIQGRRKWNVLWSALREAGVLYDLASIRLNVNIPHLHESFYASWKATVAPAEAGWRVSLALVHGGRPIGRLLIEGRTGGAAGLADMQHLLDFLEPLEAEVGRIVDDAASTHTVGAAPDVRAGELAPPVEV